MPTAGRLTAAVFFAALAWAITDIALAVMPSVYDRPLVPKFNAALAAFVAWSMFGKLDGTLRHGVVLALSTAFLTAGMAALCHASTMTFAAAKRGRTGSLIDTFEAVFSMMGDILYYFVQSYQAVLVLVLGALAIGAVSALMQRRFT